MGSAGTRDEKQTEAQWCTTAIAGENLRLLLDMADGKALLGTMAGSVTWRTAIEIANDNSDAADENLRLFTRRGGRKALLRTRTGRPA